MRDEHNETYGDLAKIRDEVRQARRFYERQGFSVVDATDKPIEESAEEILAAVTERLGRGRGAVSRRRARSPG